MAALTIPKFAGVMLLPDCTLFPHGALPLHIFEPRYRAMLDDALTGDCLFCIARLLAPETKGLPTCAAPVGTIGLIRASRQQASGTSDLILHGVIRVHFDAWLPEKPYPFAHITPVATTAQQPPQAAARRLRDAVTTATQRLPEDLRTAIHNLLARTDDPVILADLVSQQFLRDPDERQHVLELEELDARVEFLEEKLKTES